MPRAIIGAHIRITGLSCKALSTFALPGHALSVAAAVCAVVPARAGEQGACRPGIPIEALAYSTSAHSLMGAVAGAGVSHTLIPVPALVADTHSITAAAVSVAAALGHGTRGSHPPLPTQTLPADTVSMGGSAVGCTGVNTTVIGAVPPSLTLTLPCLYQVALSMAAAGAGTSVGGTLGPLPARITHADPIDICVSMSAAELLSLLRGLRGCRGGGGGGGALQAQG